MTTTYNTATWLLWVLAALMPALLTRNPLYLVIILLVCLVVRARGSQVETSAVGFRLPARIALAVLALTTLFNGLTLHYGDTPLFALPRWIPVFGGPITLEALTFGATSGLAIVTLFAIFAVFNMYVDHAELLKMTPAFLFQAGLAASIAITYFPQTLASLGEIREAQMIRGHRVRGLRDLLPLFLPLLTTGLEKSVQLAESMESRGFGSVTQIEGTGSHRSTMNRLALTTGLLILLAGLYIRYFAHTLEAVGWVLILAGVLIVVAALWQSSRQVKRSRYRRHLWQGRDLAVATCSIAVAGLFLWLNVSHGDTLLYYPYPKADWPPFDPLIGVSLLLLGLPALSGWTKRPA